MASESLFQDIQLDLPGWVPEEWIDDVVGEWEVTFAGDELEALHKVERQPMSEWAESGGYVALGASGSDWSNDVTPHAVKIMDTWWEPTTREVVFCAVEQDGKTAVMYNCLGGSQDMDPGPAMVIMPSEKKAGDVSSERIGPMFRNSRRLKRILSERADDTARYLLRLKNGGRIFLAWANSADALSSWPIKYLFFDETDKYPAFVSRETDPITLGERRCRTFEFDHKIFKASTPSRDNGGYIYKELESCSQIWEWHLRCTHCGDTFRAGSEHLVIPEGADVESIRTHRDKVGLACPCCGAEMTERERRMATRMGVWICRKGADLKDPEKVGFHRRAYDCKDVSLAKIGIAFLKMKSGDRAAQISWANGFECTDFEEELSERKEDAILQLRDERREAELPSEPIAAISCVADMQKRGFWYKITAWGYGIEQESWLLKAGFVDSWEALRRVMFESEFTDAAGNRHHVTLRGMDSGGGDSDESELSRTAEAYIFAYSNPGVLLFKGQQRMSALHRFSPLDKIPGTNRALPGGLKYYLLNATEWKNRLAAKLQVAPADPGAWHLHRDVGDDFARQICAEGRDEKGFWQNPKNRPNHLWDCSYMELALVDIHQVKLWPRPGEAPAARPSESIVKREINKRRRW